MLLTVLGSSSKGNGYILDNGQEALILECGVNIKEAKKALQFNIRKVAGCVVTHQHNDHAGHIAKYADLFHTLALPVDGKRLLWYPCCFSGKRKDIPDR